MLKKIFVFMTKVRVCNLKGHILKADCKQVARGEEEFMFRFSLTWNL